MRLLIQIPCYNEEETLGQTISELPRSIPGVDRIEILVIDDGSSDRTSEIARQAGVNHLLKFKNHRGLAKAFSAGLSRSLDLGADVIVNLDADNQYSAACIEDLLRPIVQGQADVVLGVRDFESIREFSKLKRFFQRLGSRVMSVLCNVNIRDAATGFRAFSRESALRLNVFTKYTYTLETLIHASQNGEKIVCVPIKTNPVTRPSRLFSHPVFYVLHSAGALVRLVVLYNPLRAFGYASGASLVLGVLIGLRFASVLGACLFFSFSVILLLVGLILDQVSVNRRLLETIRSQLYERQSGTLRKPEGLRIQLAENSTSLESDENPSSWIL